MKREANQPPPPNLTDLMMMMMMMTNHTWPRFNLRLTLVVSTQLINNFDIFRLTSYHDQRQIDLWPDVDIRIIRCALPSPRDAGDISLVSMRFFRQFAFASFVLQCNMLQTLKSSPCHLPTLVRLNMFSYTYIYIFVALDHPIGLRAKRRKWKGWWCWWWWYA